MTTSFFLLGWLRRESGGVDVVGTENGKLLSPSIDGTAFLVAANSGRAGSSRKISSPWAFELRGLHEGGGCLFVEMKMEAPIEWIPGKTYTR